MITRHTHTYTITQYIDNKTHHQITHTQSLNLQKKTHMIIQMIHSNNDTHKKLFYSTLKHEPCMGTMQGSPWNLSQEGKIHEKGLKC